MITTAQPLQLRWLCAGEVVTAQGLDGRPEPWVLWSRCDAPHPSYHCRTCGQALGNVGQLEMHLEDGGVHEIAVYCSRHRSYEAGEQPSSFQLDIGR